jgi:hypothetical protein
MASPAQIAANRLNSRRSTGSGTSEGQASAPGTHYSPSVAGPQGTLRLAPINPLDFSNLDA